MTSLFDVEKGGFPAAFERAVFYSENRLLVMSSNVEANENSDKRLLRNCRSRIHFNKRRYFVKFVNFFQIFFKFSFFLDIMI